MRPQPRMRPILAALLAALLSAVPLIASSHRDAPSLVGSPEVDATDFFMFRSYEAGRDGYITLIADYNPNQSAFAGPNYFPLDENAFYDIHIINGNHTDEDLTFRFRFKTTYKVPTVVVGTGSNQLTIAAPMFAVGPAGQPGAVGITRTYTVRLIHGDIRHPTKVEFLRDAATGLGQFPMPLDNIGEKTIPDYETYARSFIRRATIPGCAEGKVFAGQRKEPFQGDLDGLFDTVNVPYLLGDPAARTSPTAKNNVTSIALEVPTPCLVGGGAGLVSAWTTARLPRTRILRDAPTLTQPTLQAGDYVQVSRLGNPLVDELLIGLPDKSLFNASHPRDDADIVNYVTNPALPEIIAAQLQSLGVQAPNLIPRQDLIVGFMTGLPGLNQGGPQGEVMRLNTLIPPVPAAQQNPLGVVVGDLAGYPDGRRPGDDVVDNSLRVLMGSALTPAQAPSGQLPYTDGIPVNALMFDEVFPYLKAPLPASPRP